MFNIVVGVAACLYGYVTGDLWPALLGGVLAVLIFDGLMFLSVVLAAAILGLCVYYFWGEIIPSIGQGLGLKEMGATVLYMGAVFGKAMEAFRG